MGDSRQDWMAVLSITEGIILQLQQDLPHIKKVNIQSDNAKCYQNGCLIFGLFMLFRKYSLILRSYIHTETQDGKSSIDAHFAVCMRHVLSYVNMGMNVISPFELYKALNANGGVGNTVATLFEIDRTSIESFAQEYANAFKYMNCIKRCNEVVFGEKSLSIYIYSGISPCQIDLTDLANPRGEMSEIVEDNEEDDDNDSEEQNGVEEQNNDEVYDETGEEDAMQNHDFDDFRGKLTNCGFTTTALQTRESRKRKRQPEVRNDNLLDDFLVFLDEIDELVCTTCSRTFSTAANMNQHVCKGAAVANDLLSVALRHAHSLITDGKVDFIDTTLRGDVSNTAIDSNANVQAMMDFFESNLIGFLPTLFKTGWAVRAKYGKAYGAKYIENYKEEIDAMYSLGCDDQRNKMGSGRILETLRNKYPNRLDLPSEIEIRQRITALTARYKKHGAIRIKRGMQEPFKTLITNMVQESSYSIKPKDAAELFKENSSQYVNSDDYPTDAQVKSFVSALKSKHKTSAYTGST